MKRSNKLLATLLVAGLALPGFAISPAAAQEEAQGYEGMIVIEQEEEFILEDEQLPAMEQEEELMLQEEEPYTIEQEEEFMFEEEQPVAVEQEEAITQQQANDLADPFKFDWQLDYDRDGDAD